MSSLIQEVHCKEVVFNVYAKEVLLPYWQCLWFLLLNNFIFLYLSDARILNIFFRGVPKDNFVFGGCGGVEGVQYLFQGIIQLVCEFENI